MFGIYDFSISVSEAAMTFYGGDDIPTEVETRSQSRCRRAVVTRRLISLAGSVSCQCQPQTQSRVVGRGIR